VYYRTYRGVAVALETMGKEEDTQLIWNLAYGVGSNVGC